MKEPIRVIQGKYGMIRVFHSEEKASQDEFRDLKRYMTEALYRQKIKKAANP